MEMQAGQLFETDGNPVPPRAHPGKIAMRDGKIIRYARFEATGRPLKGTVLLIQGRNECIEKYFETAADLAARGFAVLTYDLRGQGGSDRLISDPQRGYIDSFDHYVGDLEEIFENVALPDCRPPYYAMAHSTGGLIALLAAPQMINRIRRMVLTAPLLAFARNTVSMSRLHRIASVLYFFGMGKRYLGSGPRPAEPPPFSTNLLTTDRTRFARNQLIYKEHPELALGGPTVAWIRAVCQAVVHVTDPAFMARIHIPTLFVAAGSDEVVSTPATEDYAERLRSGSLLSVDGARHELLQETDLYREQVLAAFDAFIPGSDQAAF
ncbi:alpha/beta hydrolase [Mesorhizobium sp. Z1-4]|uniref:alpha/beta fold hydrolase n=1 Tax=Mesorhizobium sp. Z1-4 TaxID=2448478 RepID=UPI000FD8E967|nr:alpha/beta hydrolase [Mesorhizobium sp. Z1-4]